MTAILQENGESSAIAHACRPFGLQGDEQLTRNAVTLIELETVISAPVETCFDASRDIGLHLASAADTGERVLAGRTSGLCELGDTITWEARHFGLRQRLTVEICEMRYPEYFVDRMVRGAFASMRHEHRFAPLATGEGTLVRDRFFYEVPFGPAGWIFDRLLLERHMRKFLLQRNACIKQACESAR